MISSCSSRSVEAFGIFIMPVDAGAIASDFGSFTTEDTEGTEEKPDLIWISSVVLSDLCGERSRKSAGVGTRIHIDPCVESLSRFAHRGFQLRGSERRREDVQRYRPQFWRALGDTAGERENFIARRRRGNPRAAQVAVVFHSGNVNLDYAVEREAGEIFARVHSLVVRCQPDVRHVDQKTAAGTLEKPP